jgi:lysophospholipase L1-like esterase
MKIKTILFKYASNPIRLSLILFFGLLLTGEIGVRLFMKNDTIRPDKLKKHLESTNPLYAPSLFSRHVFQPREHYIYYSKGDTFRFKLEEGFEDRVKWVINEKGYRGKNFSTEKPKGVIRIIIYGGSFVFDIRTKKDMDWPHQVEDMLQEEGYPVEVINAGIPGHMSFDSFGRFFTEGHNYDPDYVILCNKWNDIKYFRSDIPLLRQMKPLIITHDPRTQYQGILDRWLCKGSQLYTQIRYYYYSQKLEEGDEEEIPEEMYASDISEIALKQYQLHIQLFVDAARNLGIVPVLMTQPLLVARNNTAHQKKLIENEKVRLTHEGLCKASERADNIFWQIAEKKDVFLIDASERLSGKEELFTDHVHLTEKGANELAKLASMEIKEILKK